MTLDMIFEFDASAFAGCTGVVYEYLYQGDLLLSSHADPEDKGQMVEVRRRAEEAVKTGDELPDMGRKILLAASSASAGAAAIGIKVMFRRKKRRGK